MPTMRAGVSSLIRIAFFTAALCVGRDFALQAQAPQTAQQTEAQDALNQGVQAYKNGQMDEAILDFRHAKELDPQLLNARLYLATAYASLYIPGAPSEENKQKGESAIAEYREILNAHPENLSAIDGIGSLLFNIAGTPPVDPATFKESKSFHQKHIQIKPEDPAPYYWIGVIDWTLTMRANLALRSNYNKNAAQEQVKEDEPLPPFLQVAYAEEWRPTIDEGISSLQKAITLKPDYDDAMAYLSLLYRRKGDAVTTQAEREELTKLADDLIDKVKEIKQKRADSQPQ